MDKTVMSGEEAVEEKVAENDSSGKVHTDDVEMEEAAGESPSGAAELDEADEEVAERPSPDCAPKDRDNLCTVCGFSAKCPRSLKIHFARKHGKMSDKAAKEKNADMSDGSRAGIQQEADMEAESGAEVKQKHDSDHDELRSVTSDSGTNMKSLTKKQQSALDRQQVEQEAIIPTQERRVSKRTPKPKIIYSCNYCGQEFRDKSPLDVHIHRYHTKDTPYTCEYLLFSSSCFQPQHYMLLTIGLI